MKFTKISILILSTVLAFAISACKTPQGVSIPDKGISKKYNNSLRTWNKLKVENNNSYTYTVSVSSWVGYREATKITVRAGKAVEREFFSNKMDGQVSGFSEFQTVYQEKETDINTHHRGYKAITIDEIYKTCGGESLQVSGEMNDLHFSTNDEGILKACGSIRKGCMDDCFGGVSITAFEWL